MHYSPESLEAFVMTVNEGSFSAASRALGKGQSTVSALVANLEDDMGVKLFDRSSKYPILTEAGHKALGFAQAILDAGQRLQSLSLALATGVEVQLTLAISDMLPATDYNQLLQRFSSQFPYVELDIITAEDEDILNLIKTGRASIGIINADNLLPLTIKGQLLTLQTTMSAWISDSFLLHQVTEIQPDDLRELRKLTLKTMHQGNQPFGAKSYQWTANSYLLLMDMVQEGYGWSILPDWLVTRFCRNLKRLNIVGLPRQVDLQVIYSASNPLGPAAQWVIALLRSL